MTQTNDPNINSPSETKGEGLSHRIGIRLSDADLAKIEEIRLECGLNLSEYARLVLTGHKPKCRLGVEELQAIDTLDGCRKQLQQFINRTKNLDPKVKSQVFKTPEFYNQWKAYIEAIIEQWKNIRENLTAKIPM